MAKLLGANAALFNDYSDLDMYHLYLSYDLPVAFTSLYFARYLQFVYDSTGE